MRVPRSPRIALACVLTLCSVHAGAGGGPLGIDHRLSFDNSGIWKRGNQKALIALMVGTELIGGMWEGGESRLGRTFWQSIDATALGVVSSETMKHVFTRARPSQTDDPDRWFQEGSNYSFPSGEVTATSAIVTPFILEYRHDYPAVYGMLLLPMYDAVARMKVRGHWQTDVLGGFALGGLAGYYAHARENPLILGVLPHGFMVGLRKKM